MKLSLITAAKSLDDPKLKELIASIERQDFPKDEMEHLIITEGTSESAKAIGIRRAKGEVVGFLASDNELIDTHTLSLLYSDANNGWLVWPIRYAYVPTDNLLNRYFSLIGGNDPLCYYMGKNDRFPYFGAKVYPQIASIGDNGFFIKKSIIEQTDLDNYYHIDNAQEASVNKLPIRDVPIWHKTGGNIFSFFRKRYHYGLQHAFNKNRRWHLVDFKQPRDIWKLFLFIFFSLTLVQPLWISLRGYLKIRDVAWFLHPICCLMTVFTYGLLMIHLGVRRLVSLLSSAPMAVQKA